MELPINSVLEGVRQQALSNGGYRYLPSQAVTTSGEGEAEMKLLAIYWGDEIENGTDLLMIPQGFDLDQALEDFKSKPYRTIGLTGFLIHEYGLRAPRSPMEYQAVDEAGNKFDDRTDTTE